MANFQTTSPMLRSDRPPSCGPDWHAGPGKEWISIFPQLLAPSLIPLHCATRSFRSTIQPYESQLSGCCSEFYRFVAISINQVQIITMAAMMMNQALSIGSSEFTGKALRQATVAKAAQSVSFTVRAAGYEEELVKTAVILLTISMVLLFVSSINTASFRILVII